MADKKAATNTDDLSLYAKLTVQGALTSLGINPLTENGATYLYKNQLINSTLKIPLRNVRLGKLHARAIEAESTAQQIILSVIENLDPEVVATGILDGVRQKLDNAKDELMEKSQQFSELEKRFFTEWDDTENFSRGVIADSVDDFMNIAGHGAEILAEIEALGLPVPNDFTERLVGCLFNDAEAAKADAILEKMKG